MPGPALDGASRRCRGGHNRARRARPPRTPRSGPHDPAPRSGAPRMGRGVRRPGADTVVHRGPGRRRPGPATAADPAGGAHRGRRPHTAIGLTEPGAARTYPHADSCPSGVHRPAGAHRRSGVTAGQAPPVRTHPGRRGRRLGSRARTGPFDAYAVPLPGTRRHLHRTRPAPRPRTRARHLDSQGRIPGAVELGPSPGGSVADAVMGTPSSRAPGRADRRPTRRCNLLLQLLRLLAIHRRPPVNIVQSVTRARAAARRGTARPQGAGGRPDRGPGRPVGAVGRRQPARRARNSATLARLPHRRMSHQRREPVLEPSR